MDASWSNVPSIVDIGKSLPGSKLNENKQEEISKINILVVWRWWWNHDAPNLTDTIILASIHPTEKTISLFSIPRDLYVEYEENTSWKINGLFATYGTAKWNPHNGMLYLERKVSQITWEKIHYYVNVDFRWFKKIIDTIGGIELTLENNFIDTEYPDWNGGYKTLFFKKWSWLFDGENALKYARSRHSTSDFDRALRQQKVISAVKAKLTGSYFLKSPTKIKEMYDIFKEYVLTDMKLEDIIKLSFVLKAKQDYEMISFNLNDSCFYGSTTCSKWWFLYIPNREFFWWMSVLLLNGTDVNNLNDYSIVQKYTDLVFNHPQVYLENYKVNIFNSIKVNNLAGIISNDVIKYGYNIPQVDSIWNTKTRYDESVLYYNNIDVNSATLQSLKKFFTWEMVEVDYPVYSQDLDTKIELIIGEDYQDIFKF